jgi:hypothetical protein
VKFTTHDFDRVAITLCDPMRSNTLTLLDAEEQVKPVNAAIEELLHE